MPRVSFKNKDSILEVAKKQFAKKGYRGTTMSSIARACDMNKASLYYYFSSKKDLYREVLTKIYSEISESFTSSMAQSKDYIERAKELVAITIDFIANNRDLVEIAQRALLDKDRIVMDLIRKEGKVLVDSLKVFIELGIRSGRLKNFSPEAIIQIVLGACAFYFMSVEISKVIFGDRNPYSKEEVEKFKETVVDVLSEGLLENSPKKNSEGK